MSPPKMLALNSGSTPRDSRETMKANSGAETVLHPASHDDSSVNRLANVYCFCG
jgi:hypothetical protein